MLTCHQLNAGNFATGASEWGIPQRDTQEYSKETYLTLGSTGHRNPKQSSIFGTAAYGYGYGQLELGRTYNIRARNSGGFIINPDINSLFLGLEPVTGDFKFGSQVSSNKYFYNPGVSAGLQTELFGASIVPVAKIGPVITNINEPNSSSYQPDYGYHRTYGVYFNAVSIASFGYTNTWYSKDEQTRHSSNVILFRSVNFTYEDGPQEKLYTITLDL